ncbi:hypothetical protein Sjap_010661 [Stephania japonica]|uniref:Carbohydrate kinase FGGY C-terminal domain-containing protein n=1 Tax=Stephania japonica TaxID=461633 RepID=A0AAP0JA02_9MAGN
MMSLSSSPRQWSAADPTPLLARQTNLDGTPSSTSASSASIEMETSPPPRVFLGVDVGTGSARAGRSPDLSTHVLISYHLIDLCVCLSFDQCVCLFDEGGKLLGSASSHIQIWKEGDCIEQSSTDIWHAICAAVKAACSLANVDGKEVISVGFAATCSLVAVDADGAPVTVSWSGDARRNIIVWMDHRAVKQAECINSSNSPVLQYCGGALSPEQQPPKSIKVLQSFAMPPKRQARRATHVDEVHPRDNTTHVDRRMDRLMTLVENLALQGQQLQQQRHPRQPHQRHQQWFEDEVPTDEVESDEEDNLQPQEEENEVLILNGDGDVDPIFFEEEQVNFDDAPKFDVALEDFIEDMVVFGDEEIKVKFLTMKHFCSLTEDTGDELVEEVLRAPHNNVSVDNFNLLWVKENLPESWSMAFRWMDLSDWLSYRATGDDTRSLCTTVCKWTYLGHAHMQQPGEKDFRDMEACGWDDDFWEEIGLGELVDGHHSKIGRQLALYVLLLEELGLVAGTPVGSSMIDAHAGGVGVMESVPVSNSNNREDDKEAICHRMVLVCGTSTCHMAVSQSKLFIPGVWGPFWSAMIPGYWLTEGGQSATGALLDHIINNHVAAPHLANRAASQCISLFELLNKILDSMMHEKNAPFLAALAEDLHVLPEFHGNRSPIADPKAKGIISGLTIDASEKQLSLLYLATVQAIAYGTRHIVEHCNSHGHKIDTLLACGGLAKNPLYIQQHADITGCSIILPRESESVLLGAAILGAVADKKYSSLRDAMKALNAAGQVIHPSSNPRVKKFHDAKYCIFRELYEQQLSHRVRMKEALA